MSDDNNLAAWQADHGISPAQLREKVEALEKRMHYIDASLAVEHLDALAKRIDAALKRIALLERDMNDVHPNALSGGNR